MLRSAFLSLILVTPAFADGVTILPGYSDFRTPKNTIVDMPMSYVQDWVAGFPEEGAHAALQLDAGYNDAGILTIEITESGLADDSVSAIQKRFELRLREDWRWELVAYGFRQKCYRGGNGDWQANPCA